MDWYLDGDDLPAVSALRREIRDYLARHAAEGSDLDAAEMIVSELLGNAVRHARGAVWVQVAWQTAEPVLVVLDLGRAATLQTLVGATGTEDVVRLPAADAEGGRGLYLVKNLALSHELTRRPGGGARAQARLPVRRSPARDADPPSRVHDALPSLDEAAPGGGFPRESFLRALVVQLAQAIEHAHGPDAAEHLVAQVGATIGAQMEREFRTAQAGAGPLTPEQLADCLVRLKAAIGGGFHVVEVTPEHIVLGNTRCPFGEVVRRSPALCRMTSSVFGGIAARNAPYGAAVTLEERIAVGDPGCRVVIHLGRSSIAEAAPFAHRYGSGHAPDPEG